MKNLAKVIVYIIEVPENTDLNRYFEIMNTRGEQLEQHDILKATLMSYLSDEAEKGLFAKIWDACSDMTGYVQMHFKNTAVREAIFGSEWNRIPENDWSSYNNIMQGESQETTGYSIRDIINDNSDEEDEGYIEGDIRVRFESIIEFPYFLLHTLNVFVKLHEITHAVPGEKIIDELLDDKKLIDSFKRVVTNGITKQRNISDNKENFSKGFIICLLRTRYLFDKYIIKREYVNDSTDGKWSLRQLYVSDQQSKRNPYYKNSEFTAPGERTSKNEMNIMIQSALRVSYISLKGMHWVTTLLIWLSEYDCKHIRNGDITKYDEVVEQIAIDAVKKSFFDKCKDGVYAMGVNTPHIVFNYLDYLLWYNNRDKYKDFVFEFRNSVEHWYPQNPSEGTFEPWKDGVDQFGNLCIVPRNVNSKFSNMSPEAKKSTFKNMIAKGSIKLRIMSKYTEKNGDKSASLYWKETMCKKHEEEMLKYLTDKINKFEKREIPLIQ